MCQALAATATDTPLLCAQKYREKRNIQMYVQRNTETHTDELRNTETQADVQMNTETHADVCTLYREIQGNIQQTQTQTLVLWLPQRAAHPTLVSCRSQTSFLSRFVYL